MPKISYEKVKGFNVRDHTTSQAKDITMYYIQQGKDFAIKTYYAYYKASGGKLSLLELRKQALK